MAIPSDISSIDAWYDPTRVGTLTLSGTDVDNWDSVVGPTPVLKGDIDNEPQYGNRMGPNGLACITFDGAIPHQFEVVASSIIRTQPYEIWVTVQITAQLGSLLQYIIHGGTAGKQSVIRTSAAGNLFIAAPTSQDMGAYPTDGLPHILRAIFNGAASDIYVDGVARGVKNSGLDDLQELVVGATGNVGSGLYGKIGDVFVSNTLLSAGDAADMLSYQRRWTHFSGKGIAFDTAHDVAFDVANDVTEIPIPLLGR